MESCQKFPISRLSEEIPEIHKNQYGYSLSHTKKFHLEENKNSEFLSNYPIKLLSRAFWTVKYFEFLEF